MSQTTTLAPSSAISSAMPRPMPRAAPVTMATLPATIPAMRCPQIASHARVALLSRSDPTPFEPLALVPHDADGRDKPAPYD